MTRKIGIILEETNDLLESNQTTTSKHQRSIEKHNTLIRWLTFWIVFFGALTVWSNFKRTGQYVITTADGQGVYVLDTKTSKLWVRALGGVNIYMGTNEKPEHEVIKKIKIFDPIAEGAVPLEPKEGKQ